MRPLPPHTGQGEPLVDPVITHPDTDPRIPLAVTADDAATVTVPPLPVAGRRVAVHAGEGGIYGLVLVATAAPDIG